MQWYESQAPGLGEAFLIEVLSAVHRVFGFFGDLPAISICTSAPVSRPRPVPFSKTEHGSNISR